MTDVIDTPGCNGEGHRSLLLKINFNLSFPADSFMLRVGSIWCEHWEAAAGYHWLEFTCISLIVCSAIICLQSQRGSFWSLGMRENEVSWQLQNIENAFGGIPITVCEYE